MLEAVTDMKYQDWLCFKNVWQKVTETEARAKEPVIYLGEQAPSFVPSW